MTAEVAIINKSAIAVAADSAVTAGKNKVHRNANKIFSLCEGSAIGVMVYGHAEFSGIPWETIIKIYRKGPGSKNFLTVRECFNDFMIFLKSPKFLTAEAQERNLTLFFISLFEELKISLKHTPSRQISAEILKCLSERQSSILQNNSKLTFQAPSQTAFRKHFGETIWTVFSQIFGEDGWKVPTKLKSKVIKFGYVALCSSYTSSYTSGVVVFGFGLDEMLPQLIATEVDGCAFDQIRAIDYVKHETSQDDDVSIIPFADRSEMQVLVEGIHSKIKTYYRALMYTIALEIANRVIEDNFAPTKEETRVIQSTNKKVVKQLLDQYDSSVADFIRVTNVDPMLDVVRILPKEEMATLAEALVEVTALKKKVSMQLETVGGPVDVCIVTKGDGLVWIKRKHYFDIDKNLHFLENKLSVGTLLRRGSSDVKNEE